MQREDMPSFAQPLACLKKECTRAADVIQKHKEVVVASHIDADGLTSAGIACTMLNRANIEYQVIFLKQLDHSALGKIADMGPDLVIFTDLGSGMQNEICDSGLKAIIADHHRPSGDGVDLHINPHLAGLDGAIHLSGSGTSFLLSHALDEQNEDLAGLAIVGAVGDLQDMAHGQLIGINRYILERGRSARVLSYFRDVKLFGKQTRPVFKMIQFSQDPYFPGLSGNEDACITFLKETGIRLRGERWRRWIDMNQEEKAKIVSNLMRRGLRSGLSNSQLERLIGEVYILLCEKEGTELRDASEYSTLLNATARYGHSDIGLRVCMGDRDKTFEEAQRLLNQHRQNLVNGLKLVKDEGLTTLNNLQYFDAGDRIQDTIVGIIAGMSFQMADRSKPILAFAKADNDDLKISARGTQDLVRKGLNLADALSNSAGSVGGVGGGHNVAAGATIPPGKKEEFLEKMDELVGLQFARRETVTNNKKI